jgi:hypothetical protein
MAARSAEVEELFGGVQSSQSSGETTFSYTRRENSNSWSSQRRKKAKVEAFEKLEFFQA